MTLVHGREQSPRLAVLQALLGKVAVVGVHRCVSVGEQEFPGMSVSLLKFRPCLVHPLADGCQAAAGPCGRASAVVTLLEFLRSCTSPAFIS